MEREVKFKYPKTEICDKLKFNDTHFIMKFKHHPTLKYKRKRFIIAEKKENGQIYVLFYDYGIRKYNTSKSYKSKVGIVEYDKFIVNKE